MEDINVTEYYPTEFIENFIAEAKYMARCSWISGQSTELNLEVYAYRDLQTNEVHLGYGFFNPMLTMEQIVFNYKKVIYKLTSYGRESYFIEL